MKYNFNLLFLFIFISMPLQAEMLLNKGVLNFYGGKAVRDDIEISNTGKDTLYLSTTVFQINNPESDTPERIELTDPRTAGILASPNKLIVPAGGKKIVRVIARQAPGDKDKVYRIKVMPHAPPVKAGDDSTKQTGIKVLLGYELPIFIRPVNLEAKLEVDQQGNLLKVTNAGNTNTIVRTIRQCQDADNCTELKGKRLYAGQSWEVKLPQAEGKIIINKSIGDEFSSDEY